MKKILLLLITIYSFSFSLTAGLTSCSTGDTTITNVNFFTPNSAGNGSCSSSSGWSSGAYYNNQGALKFWATLTRDVRVSYGDNGQCMSKDVKSNYSECDSTFLQPSNDLFCTSKIELISGRYNECNEVNKTLTLLPDLVDGFYDENGNAGCNMGYSLTGVSIGIPACMQNPDNGTYNDKDEVVCNLGYLGNLNGGCDLNSSIESGVSGNGFNFVDENYNIIDGAYYNKSPNTGILDPSPVENSNGFVKDPESGKFFPSCNSGFYNSSNIVVSPDGSYASQSCSIASAGSGGGDTSGSGGGSTGGTDTSTGSTGSTGGTDTSTGDTSTGSTGGTGTSTGDTSTGSTGGTGTSTGGTGTSTGGTGASTGGETGETGDTNDITPPLVADTCSDVNLTLQEKMLCELNQGMKNQNSEADPKNSLNNLLKDLTANNIKDNMAINLNVKDVKANTAITNSKLDTTNKNLGAIAGKQDASNVYLKNVDQNISDIKSSINDSSFSNTATSDTLNSMKEDNEGIFNSAKEAYSNLSNTYDAIKENYQSLKDFVDGKKSENATISISSVSLPKKQVTIFGKTLSMDCFFNQDLNTLFAPIRPFVTFMLNIFFVFISIKLFMNYALANRGGIV